MDRSAALVASRSTSWEARAAAAAVLASLDDAEAQAAVDLLLDDEDLAVIQSASSALLGLPYPGALRRFTTAYVAADDQVGMSMRDVLIVAVHTRDGLRSALEGLAESGDVGAVEALEDVD